MVRNCMSRHKGCNSSLPLKHFKWRLCPVPHSVAGCLMYDLSDTVSDLTRRSPNSAWHAPVVECTSPSRRWELVPQLPARPARAVNVSQCGHRAFGAPEWERCHESLHTYLSRSQCGCGAPQSQNDFPLESHHHQRSMSSSQQLHLAAVADRARLRQPVCVCVCVCVCHGSTHTNSEVMTLRLAPPPPPRCLGFPHRTLDVAAPHRLLTGPAGHIETSRLMMVPL